MPLTKIDDRGLTTPINLLDSEKIRLGTGNDLDLYHSGTNSQIDNYTGDLNIKSDIIRLRASNNEQHIACLANGAVELYYDNSKKLETVSTGVDVTGTLKSYHIKPLGTGAYDLGASNLLWRDVYITDSGALRFGNSQDFRIYHDGSFNTLKANGSHPIQLVSGSSEVMLKAITDGEVQLMHNGSKKFETSNDGVTIHSSDDGTTGVKGDFRFMQTGTSNTIITFDSSTSTLKFEDSRKAVFGAGDDLTIKHHGNHSYLDNQTGTLYVLSDAFVVNNAANGENLLKATANGAVELYYDDSKKLRTYSGGVIISSDTGHGRLVFQDTDGNFCFQIAGYDEVSYGDGGGGVVQDADGAVVIDMRKSGTNIHCHNNIKLNGGGDDDNLKLNLGASDDLQLWHDGTNSQIRNTTGVLQIGGSSNAALGCTQHGDSLFYQNDKGWSTTTYLSGHSHRHIRRHVHRLEHGQNNVATFDLLRYRKYWWGWGHIEIRLHANYYYGSQTVVGYLHGYSAGGTTNYAIRTLDQVYVNGTDHRPGGWSINLRTPSDSSPGSSDCKYVDVYAQIPNYTYGTVEVIAMSDYNESATSASMGTSSYTLFDF